MDCSQGTYPSCLTRQVRTAKYRVVVRYGGPWRGTYTAIHSIHSSSQSGQDPCPTLPTRPPDASASAPLPHIKSQPTHEQEEAQLHLHIHNSTYICTLSNPLPVVWSSFSSTPDSTNELILSTTDPIHRCVLRENKNKDDETSFRL